MILLITIKTGLIEVRGDDSFVCFMILLGLILHALSWFFVVPLFYFREIGACFDAQDIISSKGIFSIFPRERTT